MCLAVASPLTDSIAAADVVVGGGVSLLALCWLVYAEFFFVFNLIPSE